MNLHTLKQKSYLGDGAYVGHDGYQVWLYTYNGIEVTNQIALESPVINQFKRWLETCEL